MWGPLQTVKFVEVKSCSNPKLRPGSTGFLVGFNADDICNVVNSLFILLKSGKKGHDMMLPLRVESPLVDLREYSDEEKATLELVKKLDQIEETRHPYRRASTIPKLVVDLFTIDKKNLMEWPTWYFIGFILAKSMHVHLIKTFYGIGLGGVVSNATHVYKDMLVERELGEVPMSDIISDNDIFYDTILRYMFLDKYFKTDKFSCALINHFDSTKNRIAAIVTICRNFASFGSKILALEDDLFGKPYRSKADYISKVLAYYKKFPAELEKIKKLEPALTYCEFIRRLEEKNDAKSQGKAASIWTKGRMGVVNRHTDPRHAGLLRPKAVPPNLWSEELYNKLPKVNPVNDHGDLVAVVDDDQPQYYSSKHGPGLKLKAAVAEFTNPESIDGAKANFITVDGVEAEKIFEENAEIEKMLEGKEKKEKVINYSFDIEKLLKSGDGRKKAKQQLAEKKKAIVVAKEAVEADKKELDKMKQLLNKEPAPAPKPSVTDIDGDEEWLWAFESDKDDV